ncbi:MAG: preprotein translocase subunit SecB, partial [Syntrophomonadaceae bacterium]|nr:preprotein translocase subunit SecB [Syntrophomonadaceae bacterium]
KMEGAFAGNAEKLGHQRFTDMLEMNGLITLLHISRAYLLSVTAQSGINPPVKLPMVNVIKLREKKAQQSQVE